MIRHVSTIFILSVSLALMSGCGGKTKPVPEQTGNSPAGTGVALGTDPAAAVPPAAPSDAAAIAEVVKPARQGLDQLTSFHEKTWKMSEANAWHPDPEKGTIAWTFDDDRIVIAPLQILGTFDKASSTFTWAWSDPDVPEALKEDAQAVFGFADEAGFTSLQKPTMTCTEDDAWNYAALATQLGERQGAFKGVEDGKITFMTFGNVQMSKIKR